MFAFLSEGLLLVSCYYLGIGRPEDEDTTEAGLLLGPKGKGACCQATARGGTDWTLYLSEGKNWEKH